MPSGARRRKAAKKKKVLEAHINPSSNTSQGKEGVKNRNSASQNNPSHSNPFGEGNKEIEESSSSNAGGGLSNVETNQKGGLTSKTKNDTVQNESDKGSHDDDRSSSSSSSSSSRSSSSDDESIHSTKKPEELHGKTGDLVASTAASIANLAMPGVSASEGTISIVENAFAENGSISDMIASKKLETATKEQSSKPNEDGDLDLSAHAESPENFKPEAEDQPLIESRPPVPQRTSWLSCCGLCDVFTGSNR
ncbi:vitellogenin-2-like [Cucurbita maxima]|uniref:Vitellogenin-2-like n=1 Tax=Cucurbita maxima TaxID=3661 RepID=A0A6J1KR17_CUCMA|nr:vitellogenin-2-like [Cucurbita maxima]